METKRLDPSIRKNLRDLLLGYIEHCEVSQHLMARIDFPIYYHGFKFGAPVFTHTGPALNGEEQRLIGLVGLNDSSSQIASEILLQFMEILSQQPRLADASVLRIMPVANPVALELGDDAPEMAEFPILEHLVSQFHEQSVDGIVDISANDGNDYALEGQAPPSLLAALEHVRATVPQADERSRVLVPENRNLQPVSLDERWHLKLSVPHTWTGAPEIHAVARFLARLTQAHAWYLRPQRTSR